MALSYCKDFTLEEDDVPDFEIKHNCCVDGYVKCACHELENITGYNESKCKTCQPGFDSDVTYLILPILCSIIAIALILLAVPIFAISSFSLFKILNAKCPKELNKEVPDDAVPLV
ncbi:hypothetical protein EIN_013600 [Entamoeba invadens IP1]|uniref:Uncharacterized protein n=1 Tax=Entamoeba invadens IP1 TaxID=370355 RepID=L7FL36_ENTIV|nr:hypothetical protein EIN_013600 [Entamoeba invadens IP1]ELP86296.1 hypothetical protein EIN_013600 [Entamoeba invadens IP1]|eukprot:XP_004185642.1 hypothetical protein EIN_013600 [Entamoeba invadens IP1]